MQLSNINLHNAAALNSSSVSKFAINPFKFINFKGNLKEDRVELSRPAKKYDIEAKKAAAQKRVDRRTQYFRKRINYDQKELEDIKAIKNLLKNLLKDKQIKSKVKELAELYDPNNTDDKKTVSLINALEKQAGVNKSHCLGFESVLEDIILILQKNGCDFEDKNLFKSTEEKIENLQEDINWLSSSFILPYQKELNRYFRELDKGSIHADCYEPLADEETIHENLKEKNIPDRLTLSELLSDSVIITNRMSEAEDIQKIFEDEGLIKYKTINKTQIIDLDDETTKNTMDFLIQKQGILKTPSRLKKDLGLGQRIFDLMHFDFVDFNTEKPIELIDLTNEAAVKSIEKLNRFICKKSKYFWDGNTSHKSILAPASHLEQLGFGTVPKLRKMVQDGYLKGRVDVIDTPEGKKYRTQIETDDIYNYKKLIDLKEKNPSLTTFEALAKELGITKNNLMRAIMDDEAEIMPQCMFCYDSEHKFIDKTTPKNKEFIERKLFEKELTLQLRKEEKKQKELERIKNKDIHSKIASLRMKLVWHFCPDTRNVASRIAISDGCLCSLLKKDADKEEELTPKEEVILNTYRKNVWNTVGVDELKEGFKKAEEILNQYYQFGLDSIEDEEIKEIFRMYEN